MWSNFSQSADGKHAICKLCVSHELSIKEKIQTWSKLHQHLTTSLHKENVALFEKSKLEFPFALVKDFQYNDYFEIIKKSSIREGKL